jgi:hypothetical protein
MRLDPGVVPDKVVETHCCFCGQQCGIQPLSGSLAARLQTGPGEPPWVQPDTLRGGCQKGCRGDPSHPEKVRAIGVCNSASLPFFALCRLFGSSWQLIGYWPDVLLKSHPVGASLVPLLEREPVRFEQVADLCRIPVKNVFEDWYQHT